MTTNARLCELLRRHRRDSYLKQQELAKLLHVSTASVHRNESGERIPKAEEIQQYIAVLGLDVNLQQELWQIYNRPTDYSVDSINGNILVLDHIENTSQVDPYECIVEEELESISHQDIVLNIDQPHASQMNAPALIHDSGTKIQELAIPRRRRIMIWAVILLLLLACSALLWPGQTQEVRVTVLASKFWNAVPLDFAPGDTVSVVYDSGTWNINDSNSAQIATDANGYGMSKQAYNLLPDALTSALIGSFLNGRPFTIGNSRTFRATEERLMLGINDGNCGSCYGDNTGSIDVRVSVQRANLLQRLLNFLSYL